VRSHGLGKRTEEKWRFRNRTEVSLGDRVFLLRQGKAGPAVIGYGKVAGEPENNNGTWQTLVQFESIVDPTTKVLANREELLAIDGGQPFWRAQSSGVRLPESVASELEALVVRRSLKPKGEESTSNPDWMRDELILALNVYLKHRPNPPGKESHEIVELSRVLNRLGEKLFPPEGRADTFRNENGVYMKLMNFRRLDPTYTSGGKSGLTRGAKAEEEVWAEFGGDVVRCQRVAEAIISSLNDREVGVAWIEPDMDEGIQEAPEGRILTRKHLARERNRQLVESKRCVQIDRTRRASGIGHLSASSIPSNKNLFLPNK
jgi:predicted HNH restriction endonuclease